MRDAFALGAALIGAVVLLGWAFGVPLLKTVLPGLTTMKANTALGLVASGLGLLLLPVGAGSPPRGSGRRGGRDAAAAACGAVALLLGLLTTVQYLTGASLGIDELLFADPNTTSPPFPGRMAPATAAGFVCLGAAVLLLLRAARSPGAAGGGGGGGGGGRRSASAAHALAAAPAAVGYLSLAGYAYDVEGLYTFGRYVSVALNTATGFVLLATAVLFTLPDLGWRRPFAATPVARGVLARLMPVALLGPFLAGAAVVWGAREGVYDPLYGPALFALAAAAASMGLAWAAARAVRGAESGLAAATEALAASEALARESYEELDQIHRHAPVGLFALDLGHRFLRINERMAEMNGLPAEDHIGRTVREIVPGLADQLAEAYRPVFERGEPAPGIELRGETPGAPGVERDWLASYFPLRSGRGEVVGLIGAVLEVTERKAAERALARLAAEREAEIARRDARLGAWFEHATEHLFALAVAPDGRFVFEGLNPAHEQATGLSSGALRGRTPAEAFPPDLAAELEANYRRCLEAGGPIHYEEELTLPAGRKRWETSLVPVRDPGTGRVELILGSSRDVTEQRRLQAREAQGQRLEALGQLAGGIAHDFNNVMQAVAGGAGLIRRRAADPAAVDHLGRMVEDAARRGASITRRLLAFSRRGELRAEAVEPAALLRELHEVLAHTLGPNLEIRVEAGEDAPALRADKGQLETVLVNLATNARDAMPRGGALTLSAAAEAVAAGRVHAAGLPAGRYVRLAVSDTGEGMAAEVLARATEPFFTTKERGKGTGLGLAMARGFAEQSGGALSIRSTPGAGTTVALWLPVAEGGAAAQAGAAAAAVAGGAAADTPPRPAVRVLVVDDEDIVREVLAEGLEERGYAALRANRAEAALAMLDAGEAVDVLLTDLSMPGMDGAALVAEARKRRPGLPAVLLTGNAGGRAEAELALEGAGAGAFSLLRKPVGAEELAARVAAVVERAGARTA